MLQYFSLLNIMQDWFDLSWLHVRIRCDSYSYDLWWNQYTIFPGNQYQYVPCGIPDSNAMFPSLPIGISVLISIWLHCDCNYVFFVSVNCVCSLFLLLALQKVPQMVFNKSACNKKQIVSGECYLPFLFSALLATQRFH